MTLDVETRLQRAARVLDRHIDQPANEPAYLAPAPRRPRRRPLVMSVAAFAAVLAIVGAMVLTSDSTTQRTITPGQSVAPGQEGWVTLPDAPISPRSQGLVVSTGDGVFVWGGHDEDNKSDGAFLDTTTGGWRKLPEAPLAGNRGDAIGVWTGREIVVLNGIENKVRAAAFDPVAFEWRRLPDPPLTNAANAMNRAFFVDGSVVVVGVADEGGGHAPNQVARLDLTASQWSVGAASPVEFSAFFDAVSTGDEVVVVGERPNSKDACGSVVLAYRPSTDSWREIDAGPTRERARGVVVWTGAEVFVGGGGRACPPSEGSSAKADLLDVATGTWRAAPDAPFGFDASWRYGDVWTGTSVATINRDGTPLFFDPARNAWHVGVPSVHGGLSFDSVPIVWAGGSIVVWSGDRGDDVGCCNPIRGGEAYVPPPGW
jgi:hypothetical protein